MTNSHTQSGYPRFFLVLWWIWKWGWQQLATSRMQDACKTQLGVLYILYFISLCHHSLRGAINMCRRLGHVPMVRGNCITHDPWIEKASQAQGKSCGAAPHRRCTRIAFRGCTASAPPFVVKAVERSEHWPPSRTPRDMIPRFCRSLRYDVRWLAIL